MKVVFKILGALIFFMGILGGVQIFSSIIKGQDVYNLRASIIIIFIMIILGMISFFVLGKKRTRK